MPEFYMTFARKKYFPEIWGNGTCVGYIYGLPACVQATAPTLPVSLYNSFRRILIHRYYGLLPFRRSLSPKSPRVSVWVRVRIRVRVRARARVRVRNRSRVSAI